MAASVVPHRLAPIPPEADLANIFERDDPTLMSLARLEELATACSNDYPVEPVSLCGLIELRLFGGSPMCHAG
ncbi:hypothetical protein [Paraburkholderia sp. MM5477-R1]|uniref:hypothetical protein n=1 Tax=Paraburkholderia sp. MM5477-R1 TaxID=2991062 RepID=UPI003D1C38DE